MCVLYRLVRRRTKTVANGVACSRALRNCSNFNRRSKNRRRVVSIPNASQIHEHSVFRTIEGTNEEHDKYIYVYKYMLQLLVE